MTDPVSPQTGKPMRRGHRPLTLTYKDRSVSFEMPGWYCEDSDEGIHSGEDMKLSDRHLNSLKAEVDGLLKADEIRRIRKKLHLTQREAGELIGGGPNAFQKYEAGDVLASRAISSALRLLDAEPKLLPLLKNKAA